MLDDWPVIKKVIIVILVIYVAFCMIYKPNDDTKGYPDAIWGRPVKFEDSSVMPNSGIEQVVSDGQRVYVLYDSEKGVVQVYDYDGEYLHSLRLYKHLNGAFAMAAEDHVLYIKDYKDDLYVFENGEFVEILTNDAADAIMDAIPYTKFMNNSEGYEIRKGSVWRVDGQTETCIVSRPAETGIYQNNINMLIAFLPVVAIAMVRWWHLRKNRA